MKELDIGTYGMLMFENMLEPEKKLTSQWNSIREKALPLVKQLLLLNKEMEGGGFRIMDHKEEELEFTKIETEEEALIKLKHILRIQYRQWGTNLKDLCNGDYIWCNANELDIYIMDDPPVKVVSTTEDTVSVMDHFGGLSTIKIHKVLKAPYDWEVFTELYQTLDYWLEEAKKYES